MLCGLLWLAFEEIIARGAAVAVDRALRVELVEARALGRHTAIAPDAFALQAQRWAVSVEAVSLTCFGKCVSYKSTPPSFPPTLTQNLSQRRLRLTTLDAILLEHIPRTHARLSHTILRYVALIPRLPTDHTALLQLAVLTAQSVRTFRLLLQLARNPIATRILLALLEAAAVALLLVLDDLIPTIASHLQLVRFVQQTQAVTDAQRIDVVLFAAVAELVRLNVLQADDRLGHDAAVPVAAEALLACWKWGCVRK